MVPTRNEAVLSDPDRHRPALPDPQHDRHVAFPDDDGATRADSAARAAAATGASLPPEAWAPRPVEPGISASSGSSWQPNVLPGSTLTTPPNRPQGPTSRSGSGSRGAKLLAALVIVPVMFGFFSNGSHDGMEYTGDAGTGIEMPMGGDVPAGVEGVWVEPETGTTAVKSALSGTPKITPVPADTTSLRVEVVSVPRADAVSLPADVIVDTSANDFSIGSTPGGLPYAATVHLDARPTRLEVSATDLSGTVQLQCRVYAGSQLVAFSTGASTVTCTPEM